MNEHNSSEIIDSFIREQVERFGFSCFEACKVAHRIAFDFGLLDVSEFAKDAGVTENEVRQYFGGDDADESEEAADPEENDKPEAEEAHEASDYYFNNHVRKLEKDADNILDSADRDYNNASLDTNAYRATVGQLSQLNALNHQLNILTHIIAIHVKGGMI